MKRLSILALLIVGCGSSSDTAAVVPTFDMRGTILSIIAVVDVAEETDVPDLPDDFSKKQGDAPEVTPATVPETVPDPPPQPGGTAGNRFSGTVLATPVLPAIKIRVYTKRRCDGCDKMKKDTGATDSVGHLQQPEDPRRFEFLFQANAPAWTASHAFPVLHFEVSPGQWRTIDGWFDKWDFFSRYDRAVSRPVTAPAPVMSSQPNRVGAAYYPIRGNWWSGCGSWQHLTQGEHRGKFDPAWLSRLSWAEIQSLHSDDHDHRVKWQYVNKFSQTRVRYKASSLAMVRACPS